MTAKDEAYRLIIDLEKRADGVVATFPLSQLPVRAFFAGLHFVLFLTARATALGMRPVDGVASTILSRLSGVLPVVRRLSREPFGASAADAIGAFQDADPDQTHLSYLLGYAHLAQLMPEVHRGYYVASKTENGFALEHPHAQFSEIEARDILLSELSLPFNRIQPTLPNDIMVELARSAPQVRDKAAMLAELGRKRDELLSNICEARLVSDDALSDALGLSHTEYRRVQASILAISSYADELSWMIGGWSSRKNGGVGVSAESMEWASVCWFTEAFLDLSATLSSASKANLMTIIEFFSVDYRGETVRDFGKDGFFPPFTLLSDSILFSPAAVLTFFQMRNLIAAVGAADAKMLDDVVSKDFEPLLVKQTTSLLPAGNRWLTIPGVRYNGGEIDLLIVDPVENTVVVVQAKGPLPPQGARLTKRLGDRITEGVKQLDHFAGLSHEARDAVIGAAIGMPFVSKATYHALLARSCFGTHLAWERNDILLLTPALLGLPSFPPGRAPIALSEFVSAVVASMEEYFTGASPRWERGDVVLGDETLSVPLLKFDQVAVDKYRRKAWSDVLR